MFADADAHEYDEDAYYVGEAWRDAFSGIEEHAADLGIAPAALEEARQFLFSPFDEGPCNPDADTAPQVVELVRDAADRLLASGADVEGEYDADGELWNGSLVWGISPQSAALQSGLAYGRLELGLGVPRVMVLRITRPRRTPRSRRSRSTRRARSPGRSTGDDEPAPPSRRVGDACRRAAGGAR